MIILSLEHLTVIKLAVRDHLLKYETIDLVLTWLHFVGFFINVVWELNIVIDV